MAVMSDCEDHLGMKLVIIESPFAGDVEKNIEYARAAMADSLSRGEAPIASHLLYTQPGILDDTKPEERRLGIEAGLAWGRLAEVSAVYVDRGVTEGMRQGMERASREGREVVMRSLDGWAAPGEAPCRQREERRVMDRNELVEKATLAMYEARPLDLDQEDDEWKTLPDSWKEEWRDGARAAVDAILPDVIEAVREEAARIAEGEIPRRSYSRAADTADAIRGAVLGDALTTKEN